MVHTFLFACVDTAVDLEEQLDDDVEEHKGDEYPGDPPGGVHLGHGQADEHLRGYRYRGGAMNRGASTRGYL